MPPTLKVAKSDFEPRIAEQLAHERKSTPRLSHEPSSLASCSSICGSKSDFATFNVDGKSNWVPILSFPVLILITLLGFQFANVGNAWHLIISKSKLFSIDISISMKNFPTASSFNSDISCSATISLTIALDFEWLDVSFFFFFPKLVKYIWICLL